jgi:8-oxo-dGTP diphosphatase
MSAVPAAGTIPWRVRDGELQVALVHRPRYDDWSWPKGKLDKDEDWAAAAARETEEETGHTVRLGVPLPSSSYPFLDRDGSMQTKEVHYWAAEVIGGNGKLVNEIDEVAWLGVGEAHARLHYARDRTQLRAVAALHHDGNLETWPLVIVRHARALPRSSWHKADWLRPLDDRGRGRAERMVPVLRAYAPKRLVTSPSTRCSQTLAPYAAASKMRLLGKPALSEEVFAEDPTRALILLDKLFTRSAPVVLCTHGPLLGGLLERVAARVPPGVGAAEMALRAAATDRMIKGEILIAHVHGTADDAKIVAVERHYP